jgi:hypothetical protein
MCGVAFPLPVSAQSKVSDELRSIEAFLVDIHGWQTAQNAIRRSKVPIESKIEWLERMANEGFVPLQFELASMLHRRDFERSLKWYARAVLGRALDAASCSKAAGFGNLLDLVEPVRSDGIAKPHLMERAIAEALAQKNVLDPKPWSEWMCLPGEPRLTEAQKSKARAEALEDMRKEAQAFYLFAKAVELGRRRAFPIQDTNLFFAVYRGDQAAWSDDRRFLVVATDYHVHEGRDAPQQLYMWDIHNTSRALVTPKGWVASTVCAEGLSVTALVRPEPSTDGKHYLLHGQFPDLQLSPSKGAWNVRRPSDVGLGCNEPRRPPPPDLTDDDVRWLYEEHGYIETRVSGFGSEARSTLVKPDGRRISLPLAQLMHSTYVLGYARWKGAYLLQGQWRAPGSLALKNRERGQEAVLLWLYPDGRMDEVVVPYGYWDQTSSPSPMYRASKHGVVIAGTRYERDDQPGFAGLYLFEDAETPILLLPGWIEVLAISPNGCNIAVSHRTHSKRSEPSSIKIVQLCKAADQ